MSFSLIVITPEKKHPKEIEIICMLFKNGLSTLHVRKPGLAKDELKTYLQEIPKQFHKRVVIHAHYELLKEFNLKGAHLTEEAKISFNKVSFLKKEKLKIISASFHNYKDILKSRRIYEYVLLSPIFNSISKQGYKSNFDLDELKHLLKRKKNIIALGGIHSKNIKNLKKTGFYGAAVLGSIWESKNPVKNYKELVSKIK
jgi:thiamine-phosphate pyrophosphorylase